jgi:hypothetical protein
MKKTSAALVIAIIALLCTQQVLACPVEDLEGKIAPKLNKCKILHQTISQSAETFCMGECLFSLASDARIVRYLLPELMRLVFLPAFVWYHLPRLPACEILLCLPAKFGCPDRVERTSGKRVFFISHKEG